MPFFFILSLRQVGHLISRVIRISLFYQNSTCFVSAYFLKHHLELLYALTALTAPIVAKNVGMAVTDSLSMGIAAALKKSVEEIKERADQSNENIFYWQVASFLEASSDVPIEEVTRFLEQHPQGYRLGAEVFKILETTYIEKQAELIAIAFKQRVKRKIDDKKFNQLKY